MKTCALSILVSLLAFALPAAAQTESADKATSSALAWLKLSDDGKFAETWDEAGASFRAAGKELDWISKVKAVRPPLGVLVSREEQSREHVMALPGLPDGDYYLMKFNTSFAQKKTAIETVTLQREKDGVWRVIGYFIR